MPLRESAGFAVDVLVVVCLATVYVTGLTVQTLLASAIRAGRALWPSAERKHAQRSPGR